MIPRSAHSLLVLHLLPYRCNNGGQLWGQSVEQGYDNGTSMPSGMCSAGFHSLYIAFVFSLAIDFCCQVYAYFMTWRFLHRIRSYYALSQKGEWRKACNLQSTRDRGTFADQLPHTIRGQTTSIISEPHRRQYVMAG